MLISTGDIKQDYAILDTVFAMYLYEESFLSMANMDKAFEGVKSQLSDKCSALGGDGVINCRFEYRYIPGGGLMGEKQVVEIFAYGTAIKKWP